MSFGTFGLRVELLRALDTLGAVAHEAVLVGDSTSDVDAACDLGIAPIGYANKPGKRQRLTSAGAQIVIEDLKAVASALWAPSVPPQASVRP